jgi:hypothetical protein
MNKPEAVLGVRMAILTMAEIKAAVAAFERGEANVHDAIDAIAAACPEAAVEHRRRQGRKWAI